LTTLQAGIAAPTQKGKRRQISPQAGLGPGLTKLIARDGVIKHTSG